jgi:hypothetical protein
VRCIDTNIQANVERQGLKKQCIKLFDKEPARRALMIDDISKLQGEEKALNDAKAALPTRPPPSRKRSLPHNESDRAVLRRHLPTAAMQAGLYASDEDEPRDKHPLAACNGYKRSYNRLSVEALLNELIEPGAKQCLESLVPRPQGGGYPVACPVPITTKSYQQVRCACGRHTWRLGITAPPPCACDFPRIDLDATGKPIQYCICPNAAPFCCKGTAPRDSDGMCEQCSPAFCREKYAMGIYKCARNCCDTCNR